jgi:uncharacterized protein
MQSTLQQKLDNARELIRGLEGVAIAYSGGADSTLAAILALQVHGSADCVTFDTEFTSARALDLARAHAETSGFSHRIVPLKLLDDEAIAQNTPNRCYLCKKRMFYSLPEPAVLDGTNADDDPDRPGLAAAAERKVLSPLRLAGLGKDDVRQALRDMDHPAANVPSDSCLATRIPVNMAVTPERLLAVERLEDAARDAGLEDVRMRFTSDGISVESPAVRSLSGKQKSDLRRLAGEFGDHRLAFRMRP